MTKSKTIRWVTLASFCLLLTSFILYRTGYFDNDIEDTPQVQPTLRLVANSASSADTLPPKTILPSTKSAMVVREDHPAFNRRDSLARLDSTIKTLKRRVDMLSSSKSIIILNEGDSLKRILDSLIQQREKIKKSR